MGTGLRAFVLAMSLLAIVACETSDDNNIEQARTCLNNSAQLANVNPSLAATQATSCEVLIANIQTPEAGRIGAGLVLIEEQKLSSLTQIENAVSNNSNAMATSISFLVFSSQGHVTSMGTYAQRSQSAGTQELASIVSLAYLTFNASAGALGPGSTPAQVSGYVTTLAGDSTNGPVAAAALISAQQNACSGSGASSSLCTTLTNAIGPYTNPATQYNSILTNVANCINNGGC